MEYKHLAITSFTEDQRTFAEKLDNKIYRLATKKLTYVIILIYGLIFLSAYLKNWLLMILSCVVMVVFLIMFYYLHEYLQLKIRHKWLEKPNYNKFIVYLNLLYVTKDNFSILLDDNKFHVKNKSGTYYFKEITVGDINNQDNTIAVNMYTMTCCSFNRNYEEE